MLLEKLQRISEKEKKRRQDAIKYLEQITDAIAEPLGELFGQLPDGDIEQTSTEAVWVPRFNKESGEYSFRVTRLYFRYGMHYGQDAREYPGFYINPGCLFWGEDLTKVKGTLFWEAVKQICDWLTNYLPGYIEKHDKSRDDRFAHLKNITEYIKQG
jgi:hypothetical protein